MQAVESALSGISMMHGLRCDEQSEHLKDLELAFETNGLADHWRRIARDRDMLSFVSSVFAVSPHLRDCAIKSPTIVAEFHEALQDRSSAELMEDVRQFAINDDPSMAQVMKKLRTSKREISLLCGLCDLSGRWSAEKVTEVLSHFADVALKCAIDCLLSDLVKRRQIALVNRALLLILKNSFSQSNLNIILSMMILGYLPQIKWLNY